MNIRSATQFDLDGIIDIYLNAFADSEKDMVSKLAAELLNESPEPETVSLVAEKDGGLVAHSSYSLVRFEKSDDLRGYILAPVAVRPGYQMQRIGTSLIEAGLGTLREAGVDIVFVYGDPSYYSRFGFRSDRAKPFSPPYELTYPSGWQALVLNAKISHLEPTPITCVRALNYPELW